MGLGTESIERVQKIVGPGNAWVQMAKKEVLGMVGIDSIAGPSEVLIIADDSANPAWVAADLLAQAEHDVLATSILITTSRSLAEQVAQNLIRGIEEAHHAGLLRGALALFIIGYGLWSVAPRAPHTRAPRVWLAPVAGAGGGLVSTLFGGMAGPMFVVYLDALRLDKTRFRATISAILFLLALLRAGGYGSLGFYDRRALTVLALLAPAMLLGMVLGEHMHHGLNEKPFKRVVAALLVASGCTLLLK